MTKLNQYDEVKPIYPVN